MKDKTVNIREAEEGDRQAVLDLLNLGFKKEQRTSTVRGNKFWQWKYNAGIFGDSILTLAECNERIVGVGNLWPWELQCRGQILKGLQACDSVIHPEFQGKGLFKAIREYGLNIARKEGFQLIYNFPNRNSLSTYQSLGWDYLGLIPWWVKILEPVNTAVSYFADEKASGININKRFVLDICKLIEVASEYRTYDKFVDVNRKREFYKWRYKCHPTRQYGMLLHEKGYKKIAAIFTINQKGASKEMIIVDLIGNPDLTKQFFSKIIEIAKYLDISYLALMNNDRFNTDQLWKLGFFKKGMKNMVVLPIDLSIEAKVSNIQNWALVAGIHDSI